MLVLVELPNGGWVNPEQVWVKAFKAFGDEWRTMVDGYSAHPEVDAIYSVSFPTEAEARAHARDLARMLNMALENAELRRRFLGSEP